MKSVVLRSSYMYIYLLNHVDMRTSTSGCNLRNPAFTTTDQSRGCQRHTRELVLYTGGECYGSLEVYTSRKA